MGLRANGLAIALLLAASSAQAQTCNAAQYARLRELQKAYSATWDAMHSTPGREVLAGRNGVVHGKAYCAATERHIQAGETLVRFITSAGCFQPETGPTWRKRVRETIDEDLSGCRMTPKTVHTDEDRRQARKDVNYFKRCTAAKEAQGMSPGAANGVCINETLTR